MKSLAPSGVDLIKYGVSISINPSLFKYLRTSKVKLFLKIILSFKIPLLKSRYLYFILSSSPPSVSFSIVNGGMADEFKTLIFETKISISPVAIFSLEATLLMTSPSICITNSLPIFFTDSNTSFVLFSEFIISCVIPYLSLRSIQIKKPLFLIFWTHPESFTLVPASEILSSPQL